MSKILIVEDDQFISRLYQHLFTLEGYEIEAVGDGEAALKRITAGGLDLVLLDIMLPKMNGLDVLRRLRETPPAIPNGPVVLLTNLGQDSVIKEGFKLGAKGYMIKSALEPKQLVAEVKTYLAKKQGS